jgi:CheY-like chemotaxis protein
MIDRVRILIVEDDAALASGIARILEGEGHAIDLGRHRDDRRPRPLPDGERHGGTTIDSPLR